MGVGTALIISSLLSLAIGGVKAGASSRRQSEFERQQGAKTSEQLLREREIAERERGFALGQSKRQSEIFNRELKLAEAQQRMTMADDLEKQEQLIQQRRQGTLSGLGIGRDGFTNQLSGQTRRLRESRL